MANLVSTTLTGNLTVTSNVSAANYTGNGAALTGIASFASGTKMVFYQASAPTGWTQDTAAALSNTVMSVVTGTGGGTGGTNSYFSSFLATTNKSGSQPAAPVSGSVSGTVGGTTLSSPQIPSHSHPYLEARYAIPSAQGTYLSREGPSNGGAYGVTASTGATGGGASHAHPFSGSLSGATAAVSVTVPAADVKYTNVIVATKD